MKKSTQLSFMQFVPRWMLTICLFASILNTYADNEILVKSKIQEVTVFLQGAQVIRFADVNIASGTNTYVFKGLSPHLDPSGIQLKGIGDFTVLSVTPKVNYLGTNKITDETTQLRKTIDSLFDKSEEVENELKILANQEQFLNTNHLVKGENNNLVATDFEQITNYFYKQMASISRKRLEFNRQLTAIQKDIRKYQNQLNSVQGKAIESTMEVYVEVKSTKAMKAQMRLSYVVYTAGWTPSYDIRVDDITKPFALIYKASVFQNSGEDWSNVKLTFSNANPNESGNLPELTPYYLRFGSAYNQNDYRRKADATTSLGYLGLEQRTVKGFVLDNTGEPVAYATVAVSGTSVGTFTDERGRFSINLSANQTTLTFTAIGYQTRSESATGEYLQVQIVEDQDLLSTATISRDRNVQRIDGVALQGLPTRRLENRVASTRASRGKVQSYGFAADKYEEKSVTTTTVENQTTIEFTVEETYSVISGAKPLSIDMKNLDIPANYEYRSVPKLDPAAYLIAQVTDWSQYQLLEGMANLYFENTFVGRSALNVQYLSDTLDISLGKDKNVIVKRTKVKEYSGRQFLGSDQIAKRQFKIETRNNKSSAINVVVYDQVPISNTKEIEVEVKSYGDAKLNSTIGELVWRYKMEPKGTKDLEFNYNVKYPNNRIINLE